MVKSKTNLLGLLVSLLISCNLITPSNKPMHCGYELTQKEYEHLRTKADLQKSAYEADTLWHVYDQLNDSIRRIMPDSLEFEIFLSLLNNNEVGVDVIIPRNKEFFERISCAIMNSNYRGKMPDQRYMCLYSYTNPDGSGDSPLEVAIKRRK